jgi:hypothetical protein
VAGLVLPQRLALGALALVTALQVRQLITAAVVEAVSTTTLVQDLLVVQAEAVTAALVTGHKHWQRQEQRTPAEAVGVAIPLPHALAALESSS